MKYVVYGPHRGGPGVLMAGVFVMPQRQPVLLAEQPTSLGMLS